MKALRIIFGFMLMGLLLGLSQPVSALLPAEEEKTVPKAPHGDTVRMTWTVYSTELTKSFGFYGELGASYKVDWGDGKTDTYTMQSDAGVECEHRYSSEGIYKVLLFGVGTVEKK